MEETVKMFVFIGIFCWTVAIIVGFFCPTLALAIFMGGAVHILISLLLMLLD